MDIFSKKGVFENSEINTYLDRMYYFLSQHLELSIAQTMELVPLTGSVAAIIAKKILPREVKDVDLILNNLAAKAYMLEEATSIFGIEEEKITDGEDRLTIETPHVNFEMFYQQRRGLEPMRVDEFFLIV